MATTSFAVSGDAWSDLGAGPLTVIAPAHTDAIIYSAEAAPGALSDAARVLLKAGEPLNYQYTDKLFIRLAAGNAATAALKVIK